MPPLTDEEIYRWQVLFGDDPYPGMDWPEEGKCNAKLTNRRYREAEIKTIRYCGNRAGARTPHSGFGGCHIHLGKTPNIMKKYMPVAMQAELSKLAEAYDEEIGLDPPEIESSRIVVKNKRMFLALEKMVLELDDVATTDMKGAEKLKPVLELWIEVNKILSDWLKFAMRFNLETRRVELEESQARAIASMVLSVVLDPTLQLTEAQISQIRMNLQKEMNKIASKLRPGWASEFDDSDVVEGEEVE